MAIATLTFDLSNEDDQTEFNRTTKALAMALSIYQYDQWMRSQYKYEGKEEYYELREKFREFLDENNVNIDEILT